MPNNKLVWNKGINQAFSKDQTFELSAELSNDNKRLVPFRDNWIISERYGLDAMVLFWNNTG
jgi:hypothetical protein